MQILSPISDTKANKELRKTLLKLIISDYDKAFGTSNSLNIEEITKNFFKKEEEKAKQEALKKLNFQTVFNNVW